MRTRGGQLAALLAFLVVVVAIFAVAGGFKGCGTTPPSGRPSQNVTATRPGDFAWVVAKTVATTFPRRGADTWGEIKAREFIFDSLAQYGYAPRTREFIARGVNGRVHSANVVAVKTGDSTKQLVVGAHYDADTAGEGYSDNATGVGLLLELAARLEGRSTPYTIVFVAFGAEEEGSLGSEHYVKTMSKAERAAMFGMLDLDVVAGGDELYVATAPEKPTWLRDVALVAADELDVTLNQPAAQGTLLAGEAMPASDDGPFVREDIATAVFTASNWEAGDSDGRTATAEGPLWHTAKDTVAHIERSYPGRVRTQLRDLSRVLESLLTSELEKTP